MSLETYSAVISIGLFILTVKVVMVALGSVASESFRDRVLAFGYRGYMFGILLVSLAAVVGAMIYQIVYATPVCELCWWQRVFLFPIVVIAGVAVWCGVATRRAYAHISVAILSLLGLGVAVYHYYFHLQGLILKNVIAVPCGGNGILAVCGDSPILTFGFVTIPLMGMLTFIVLLILALLAGKAQTLQIPD